jgi:hypothetical protein
MSISAHGSNIETDVFAESFYHVPKVHTIKLYEHEHDTPSEKHVPHRLKDKTEMTAMLESPFQTNDMFLVVRISLLEFIEDQHLLEPSSIPA